MKNSACFNRLYDHLTYNVIDSSDILERIDFLRSTVVENKENATPAEIEEIEELENLEKLVDDVDKYAGDTCKDGVTLIYQGYFEDYCQQLVEDVGDLPRDLPSYIAIDWKQTADNLKVDYAEVDYQGGTYLFR